MDNPDALNFQPRDMILEVSRTILHFAEDEEFHAAVSESGYYREGALPCLSGPLWTGWTNQWIHSSIWLWLGWMCGWVMESSHTTRASYCLDHSLTYF